MTLRETVIDAIEDFGFARIEHIEEANIRNGFVANVLYSDDMPFRIYPTTKKLNLTHDLLSLYGTHWHYAVDYVNFDAFQQIEGDVKKVFERMQKKRKA